MVPAITELTPTLVSLTYFIKPGMYDKVPLLPGATGSPCDHAYRVNAAFLAFQFVIFAANIINLGVQGEWASLSQSGVAGFAGL